MRWSMLGASCAIVLSLAGPGPALAQEPSQPSRMAYLARTGSFWQVWIAGVDGAEPRQLTRSDYEKAHVSWFPDGRKLLVTSTEGQLFEIDAATGAERQIQMTLSGAHDGEVSPDGKRITFSASSAEARDGNEIWTASATGSELRRVISLPWLQHEPSWSPDGAWIYFVSGDGKQSHDVFRVSPDGARSEQITAGVLYNFSPAVSGDGTLAYSSNRSGDYEIWLQPVEGEARKLTESAGLDAAPSWSADGRSLLIHSSRTGGFQIFRIDLAEGADPRVTQLTRHEGGARDPVWWNAERKEAKR